MFYLPGIAKKLDAYWMQRCINGWLDDQEPNVRSEFTIVDAHFGYPEGVACFQVAQQRCWPVFITLRGLEQEHFGSPIGDQLVRSLNGATGVIAVSNSLRNAAVAAGVAPNKVRVIPNGVDHTLFRPRPSVQQPAQSRRGYLLVCVGNIKRVKGHDVLVRTLAQIRKHIDARLVIIGGVEEGVYAKQLTSLVRRLGLERHVAFTGSLPPHEISGWLQRADLFVIASRREGCCNAVLEALASGLPVVATDVGDNSQFVKAGVSGRVAPAEDVQRLSEAVELTLAEPLAPKLVASSVAELTWDHAAARVLTFFRERCGN